MFPKILHVTITQQDIDRHGRSARDCPVAMAINRQYPKMGITYVYSTRVVFYRHGFTLEVVSRYVPEMMAQQKIKDYDSGLLMTPFSFEMERLDD